MRHGWLVLLWLWVYARGETAECCNLHVERKPRLSVSVCAGPGVGGTLRRVAQPQSAQRTARSVAVRVSHGRGRGTPPLQLAKTENWPHVRR
mmetsp:Transcript_91388/g.274460  ORF Transcript_91388/g.274460 Transcript_91388/m.274460 type:complete len:92 (+) Transcript_91388:254-529(+)|eukprot:6504625-Prymnesium_polylepis.1